MNSNLKPSDIVKMVAWAFFATSQRSVPTYTPSTIDNVLKINSINSGLYADQMLGEFEERFKPLLDQVDAEAGNI